MRGFGDFNFDSLKGMHRSLERMGTNYPGFVEECLKELAMKLLSKTMERTPADTGRLRSGWTIRSIERVPGGYSIEIINPVEYAYDVEYGYQGQNGWVKGSFMLLKSQLELKREMNVILERKLASFMRQHLGW